MAAPRKIDYERLEPDWRAGLKSPAQMAAEYTEATQVSVSHAAIIKHFKKLGVPRDLAPKIRAKADAMVTAAMVTGKVSRETNVTDAQIIEDGAEVQARIRLSHRSDIGQSRELAMRLLDELKAQTENRDLFERLAELLIDPVGDEDQSNAAKERQRKRMEAFQAALSLGGRTKVMKDLGDTLKTLIALEREAFGIDDKRGGIQPGDISITF